MLYIYPAFHLFKFIFGSVSMFMSVTQNRFARLILKQNEERCFCRPILDCVKELASCGEKGGCGRDIEDLGWECPAQVGISVVILKTLFIYGVFLIMPLQGWQRSPSKEWSLKLGGSHLSRSSESFCVLLILYLLFGYSFVLWRLFLSSFFSGFLCLQFVYSCVFLIVSQNT